MEDGRGMVNDRKTEEKKGGKKIKIKKMRVFEGNFEKWGSWRG